MGKTCLFGHVGVDVRGGRYDERGDFARLGARRCRRSSTGPRSIGANADDFKAAWHPGGMRSVDAIVLASSLVACPARRSADGGSASAGDRGRAEGCRRRRGACGRPIRRRCSSIRSGGRSLEGGVSGDRCLSAEHGRARRAGRTRGGDRHRRRAGVVPRLRPARPGARPPIERDTVFGIGSITKTFTALVLRLRDEGASASIGQRRITCRPSTIAYPTADGRASHPPSSRTSGCRAWAISPVPDHAPAEPRRVPQRSTASASTDRQASAACTQPGVSAARTADRGGRRRDHRSYSGAANPAAARVDGLQRWVPEDVPGDELAVGYERMPGQPPRAARTGARGPRRGRRAVLGTSKPGPLRGLQPRGLAGARRAGEDRCAASTSCEGTRWRCSPASRRPRCATGQRRPASGSGLGFGVQVNQDRPPRRALAGKTLNYRAALLMPTAGWR